MVQIDNSKEELLKLLKIHNIEVPKNKMDLVDSFIGNEENKSIIHSVVSNTNNLMSKWNLQNRIAEITAQPVRIPNGTIGKPYDAKLDFEKLGWKDVIKYEFEGLNEIGLSFDKEQAHITGSPLKDGDLKINFKFKVEGQADADDYSIKVIKLIVNPDPKSLWKQVESDKNDPFWKVDNLTVFDKVGDKHIVVSSKRGRSHANVGSFREDDFAFSDLSNGWSIVAVSDGAGSAKVSRKGSEIACNGIVEYFKSEQSKKNLIDFDALVAEYNSSEAAETENKLNHFVYNTLGKAALSVHKKLEEFASKNALTLKDLSSTLIFTLFKKYSTGYAFLSFGVGDCPMAIINKEKTEVQLLNWIDVGEYGGGTRFITMPEIFTNEKFATRFSFKQIEDFSYLILMSDGIYDPKFVVENNLVDIKNWQAFLEDLGGKNAENNKVVFDANNKDIATELSYWMDFWSVGNHDDRTLAIIF
ncbi:MAG TPA: PP2C family serine/threonine-protein phosphatase [Cytophagaceae bacterium]